MTFVISAFGQFYCSKSRKRHLEIKCYSKNKAKSHRKFNHLYYFFSGIKIMTGLVVCSCSNTTRYVFNDPNKNNQDMINVLKLADILKTFFFWVLVEMDRVHWCLNFTAAFSDFTLWSPIERVKSIINFTSPVLSSTLIYYFMFLSHFFRLLLWLIA